MGLSLSRERGQWRNPPGAAPTFNSNPSVVTSPAPTPMPFPDITNNFGNINSSPPPARPRPPMVTAAPVPSPKNTGPAPLSQIRICPDDDDMGPQDGFSMCLDLIIDPQDEALFQEAASEWSSKIKGDVEDVESIRLTTHNTCEQYSDRVDFPPIIDDLFFCGIYREIDGPYNILGYARPIHIRSSSGLPISGVMQFDVDDLTWLRSKDMLLPLIMHEMGHVFGIGTLWNENGVTGPSSEDCPYTGEYGKQEWEKISGCKDSAPPIELDGDAMTRCLHFDETCFGEEIMTGFLNEGPAIFSSLTIATLKDLGYDTYDFDEVSDSTFDIDPQCKCHNGHDRHLRQRVFEPISREPKQRPQQKPRKRLSDEGQRRASEYGREILRSSSVERDDRYQSNDVQFIGDQFISVMVAEDGEVYTVDVSMYEHHSNIFIRGGQ